jgi:hypothetical protein
VARRLIAEFQLAAVLEQVGKLLVVELEQRLQTRQDRGFVRGSDVELAVGLVAVAHALELVAPLIALINTERGEAGQEGRHSGNGCGKPFESLP